MKISLLICILILALFSGCSKNEDATSSIVSSSSTISEYEKLFPVKAEGILCSDIVEIAMSKIESKNGIGTGTFSAESYGFSEDLISDFFIAGPTELVKVREISVFKANDSNSVTEIKTGLTKYIEAYKSLWGNQNYVIKQTLDSAKIYSEGNYVMLLILSNEEEYRVIENSFKRVFNPSLEDLTVRKKISKIYGEVSNISEALLEVKASVKGVNQVISIILPSSFSAYPRAPKVGDKIEVTLLNSIFEDDLNNATAFSAIVFSEEDTVKSESSSSEDNSSSEEVLNVGENSPQEISRAP